MRDETSGSVLVLGGTGIIGTELCVAAAARGLKVTAVARRHPRNPIPGVTYVSFDARSEAEGSSPIGGGDFDTVVDLVSFTPAQVEATLHATKSRHYIFVSSATIYDGVSAGGLIHEQHARVPSGSWLYPERKIASEGWLVGAATDLDMPYTIVRPYITYSSRRFSFGMWEAAHVLQRLANGVPTPIGDSIASASTSLTHATDMGRAIAALLNNPAAHNRTMHISHPLSLTWQEVFDRSAFALGARLDVVQMSTDELVSEFSELGGRAADRSRGRAFDVSAFMTAVPDFTFSLPPHEGISDAVGRLSQREVGMLAARTQGRLDRLVRISRPTAPPASTEGWSVRDRLKYGVGRSRALSSVSRRLSSKTSSDYAVD
ncbi:NAD-dependent epimerase/dehydratase family protein [Microbacterium sp. NPDC056569]|uniref:NAD-dependent epimerase/dehydratase family protein n=1 Tax=Microbacterium sp. NPDC056569 TaxID=3345867 RepID=UPI0036732C59